MRKGTWVKAVAVLLLSLGLGGLALRQRSRTIMLELGMFAGSSWDVQADDSYRFIDAAIEKFEATHPRVKIHYYSGIRKKDYSEWLSEQIVSGNAPDVFFVLEPDFIYFVTSGALCKLDTLLFRDTSFRPSLFYPSCYSAGTFRDGQYALPVETDFTVMGFNETLLKREGVAVPDASWTWDDFLNDCKSLTKDVDGDGILDYSGQTGYMWRDALYSNGIKTFSNNGERAQISDNRFQDAIRFMQRLSSINPTQKFQQQDFDSGHVAFSPVSFSYYRTNTSYPYKTSKDLDFSWAFTTMPGGPAGENASRVDSLLMAISSTSRHKALAYEFLCLCTMDEEVQRNIYSYARGASPLDNEKLYENLASQVNTDHDLSIIPVILRKSEGQPEFEKYNDLIAYVDNQITTIIEEKANTDITLKNLQHLVQLRLEH